MNAERLIVGRLRESRDQHISTYHGFNISIDRENIYHVRDKSGHQIGQFENREEAEDYIDDLPNKVKYTNTVTVKKIEKKYLIYKKGTYKDHEAMYLMKNKKCEWHKERDATVYTEAEKNAIIKNSEKSEGNLTYYTV